jgi:hypothetical protein
LVGGGRALSGGSEVVYSERGSARGLLSTRPKVRNPILKERFGKK